MKKIFNLMIILILFIFSTVSVSALDLSSYVVDDAQLLSDSEESNLLEKISDIQNKYNYDIVIVTVNSFDGKSEEEFADDYYDYNGYGYGSNHDGMIFVIGMQERKYWTSTTGYGITAFTDYGIDLINEKVQPYLSDGKYYEAFDKYLTLADDFLNEAKTNKPYDKNNKYKSWSDFIIAEVVIVIVSGIIAGIYVSSQKKKMNVAINAQAANQYVNDGSFNLNRREDIFLRSNTTKVKIERESSSDGGSSTHTGSSGTEHGGGGGSF